MHPTKTSPRSVSVGGWFAFFLAFGVLSLGLGLPAFLVAAATSGSQVCANVVGPVLCAEGTTPRRHSYATTTGTRNGRRPSTANELHCVDRTGSVVNKFAIGHALMWYALFVGSALGLAAVASAGAGIFVARRFGRPSSPSEARR